MRSRTCASRCASTRPRRIFRPSTTNWGTTSTSAPTRTSPCCSATARTRRFTRRSAARLLSVTRVLVKIGPLDRAPDTSHDIGLCCRGPRRSFLPFGLVIDQWRWDVQRKIPTSTTTGRGGSGASCQGVAPPSAMAKLLRSAPNACAGQLLVTPLLPRRHPAVQFHRELAKVTDCQAGCAVLDLRRQAGGRQIR